MKCPHCKKEVESETIMYSFLHEAVDTLEKMGLFVDTINPNRSAMKGLKELDIFDLKKKELHVGIKPIKIKVDKKLY